MDLGRLIDPLENRFNSVEALAEDDLVKGLHQAFYGMFKSFVRGGIIGASFGVMSGGDERDIITYALIGAAADAGQHTMRTLRLVGIPRESPEKYSNIKQFYSKLFRKKY